MADNIAITAGAGTNVASDDISGVHYQRVKNAWGVDGVANDVSHANPMPVIETHAGRTFINMWANAAASGATTVETAITLTKSAAAGAATSSAASFVVTNGKRFRVTSLAFSTRGHNTATAQTTTFSLRVNTGGAVTTTSNVWFSARSATPATANAWDRTLVYNLADDGFELVGDGTLQFGVTAVSTFTTNAPTWDVSITGYEYTAS